MSLSDTLFDTCDEMAEALDPSCPIDYSPWRAEITRLRDELWNLAKQIAAPPGMAWDAEHVRYVPRK